MEKDAEAGTLPSKFNARGAKEVRRKLG